MQSIGINQSVHKINIFLSFQINLFNNFSSFTVISISLSHSFDFLNAQEGRKEPYITEMIKLTAQG